MSGHYSGIVSFWSSLLREAGEKTFVMPYVLAEKKINSIKMAAPTAMKTLKFFIF